MHDVYLLESAVDSRRHYTGFTHNLRARIAGHNAGQNQATVHGGPWRLVSYFAFADELKARGFERYLKSGSGRRQQSNQSNALNQRMQLGYRTTGKTFAKRHFI